MRTITPYVLQDLRKKMVFIGGPRQVGKTTLAKDILAREFPGGRYFNWDFDEDRQDILKKRWTNDSRLLVLTRPRVPRSRPLARSRSFSSQPRP